MHRPRSLVVNPVATPVALWCLALLAGLFSVPPSVRVDEHPLLFAGSAFCLFGFAVSVTLALPWLWLRATPDALVPSEGRRLRARRIDGFGLVVHRVGPVRVYLVTCIVDSRTVPLRATASRHWWPAVRYRRRLEQWLGGAGGDSRRLDDPSPVAARRDEAHPLDAASLLGKRI